jgi:anthranilate phosphoribosyltransferase
MTLEHPFAQYVRILGKGRNGARSLTRDEAREAMAMICRYDVEPEQLGAFLMLMRVKEETAEEVAGFVDALRASLPLDGEPPRLAIDWPAYAGKKRQLPWFLLAALIAADNGHPVLMHGLSRDDERTYVPEALAALGLPVADSIEQATRLIQTAGFAYLPIERLSKLVHELIEMRTLLGLRPPLHTVARMLNPFNAQLMLMGVFHPNYAPIHQQAADLLGQPTALAIKGEGGEFERIPDRDLTLYGKIEADDWLEAWPALVPTGRFLRQDRLDLEHFAAVWRGDCDDAYGRSAVTGTLALVIRALGLQTRHDDAHGLANQWWNERIGLPLQQRRLGVS